MDSRSSLRQDLSHLRFTTLTLHAPDGALLEGTVLDGNGFGVAVLVSGASPPIEIDARVDLIMRLVNDTVRLAARVRNHARRNHLDRYGLEFESPTGVLEQVASSDLRELFERRSSPRVRIDEGDDAPASLRDGATGDEIRGALTNVSVDGACVEVAANDARAFEGVERVLVEFKLPGGKHWLGLPAEIRSRTLSEPRGFLSLEFCTDARDRLRFTLERIGAFVDAHEAPALRAG